MSARTRSTLPCLFATLLMAPLAASADGVPVQPVTDEAQSRPAVVSDGTGGAIVTFKTASLRVGAVHLSDEGAVDGGIGFSPAVLQLGLEASLPPRINVLSDSQLVIVSDHSPAMQPVLTSLRNGGTVHTGFPVGLPFPMTRPALVRGEAGRTVLVAKGSDASSFWTLRAAIVSASGEVESAVQLSSPIQFFNSDAIAAVTDGAGGAIAVMSYYDPISTGSKDLAIFRIAADGKRPWGDLPRPIVVAAQDQVDPQLVSDGRGGAILVWTDPRVVERSTDIYAMRINAAGTPATGWAFYGTPLCLAPGAQTRPRIVRDGLGGAWVVWLDQRPGDGGDLRYTHLLLNGKLAPGFDTYGTALCTSSGFQGDVELAVDGAGGFFAVWRDERAGDSDVYAQHIMPSGQRSADWPADGLAICTANGVQDQPAIAAVAGARAVLAWRDARAGSTRVYAAALYDPALLGAPVSHANALALAVRATRRSEVTLSVTFPADESAVLELLDVAGRTCMRTTVQGPATAREVTLRSSTPMAPGRYFARLRQGGSQVVARVTVLR